MVFIYSLTKSQILNFTERTFSSSKRLISTEILTLSLSTCTEQESDLSVICEDLPLVLVGEVLGDGDCVLWQQEPAGDLQFEAGRAGSLGTVPHQFLRWAVCSVTEVAHSQVQHHFLRTVGM